MNPIAVLEVLGGSKTFRGKFSTTLDLVDLGERGLSKASLLKLSSFLELSMAQMARLLPVTERTIQRYSRTRRLNIALGNRKPLDLLASKLGIDLVMDELGRIEHGVVS